MDNMTGVANEMREAIGATLNECGRMNGVVSVMRETLANALRSGE
jgi:hypothetical protein